MLREVPYQISWVNSGGTENIRNTIGSNRAMHTGNVIHEQLQIFTPAGCSGMPGLVPDNQSESFSNTFSARKADLTAWYQLYALTLPCSPLKTSFFGVL